MNQPVFRAHRRPPAASPQPGLVVTGLLKRYEDRTAVDGVSFMVPPATCLGLLGPNGAGKSTTMGMLAGVLRPDAGSIALDGEADPTRSQLRRRIGFVPQGLGLYQELSAEENLVLFGRLHGVRSSKVLARVAWALDFAGLHEHRARRVRSFSGGMQRRLNLACALLHEPALLLLDEPTVGVDPQSREHIFRSIEALKKAGLTIVYSTHYMEEAERLCDSVAIVDQGRVIAEGSTAELLARHGSLLRVEAEFASGAELRIAAGAPAFAWSEEPATRRFVFECEDASEVLERLLLEGEGLRELTVRRPTLETVFLALTGKRLRD
jgi:ABC-2 type transport system ATP-binding protein